MDVRLVTSNSASKRFELVSSGPKTRKLRDSVFSFITSRSIFPSTRVASPSVGSGFRHVHGVIAKIRQLQILQQQAAVGVWIGAHAPWSRRAPARRARESARRSRRTARPGL